MNFLSLYSGIGLHDLGFERAGWRCVGQVELDPFATAVLAKHWPHVPRWCDVRSVTVDAVRGACGRIDAICGGFMCTDISVAGKGAGLGKRTRSGLTWREMFRLIRGLRPVLLVIENVPRLRTLGADRVLAALERIGYACRAIVVGAEHVGAPHRRHRVWVIGRLVHASGRDVSGISTSGRGAQGEAEGSDVRGREAVGVLHEPAHANADEANPLGLDGTGGVPVAVGEAEGRTAAHRTGDCIFPGGCWRCANVADTDSGRGGQDFLSSESRSSRSVEPSGYPRLPVRSGEAEQVSRWPARPGQGQHAWEAPRLIESSVGGAASRRAGRVAGFARRNALRALGNGNPPQVAEVIARSINETMKARAVA
jgi:DNA (cytosine-5)-methyltransferase 1